MPKKAMIEVTVGQLIHDLEEAEHCLVAMQMTGQDLNKSPLTWTDEMKEAHEVLKRSIEAVELARSIITVMANRAKGELLIREATRGNGNKERGEAQ